jgi:serine/threonine protein kinase
VHDSERLSRFQREARMLASLNHPNIATIHGLEQFGDVHYLVMELVSGETLAERVNKGALPLQEALKIAGQIAEALEAAHEKGVIHRDLKPANVKVTPEGRVKVLDFGLAKAFAGDSDVDLSHAPTLSQDGRILGTPAYMSPEQANGKPVDRRADIWTFGVVLFEMLTGEPLYSGGTTAETLASVMKEEPTLEALPKNTPSVIGNLLRRCLEKNLRQRLQHIGEARIAIEAVLSGTLEDTVTRAGAATEPEPLWRQALPWSLECESRSVPTHNGFWTHNNESLFHSDQNLRARTQNSLSNADSLGLGCLRFSVVSC